METLMVKTLGAAVAGLASHWLYFVRGEHHLHAPLLFYGYILVAISIYVYERSQAGGQLDSGYLPSGFASASAIIAAYAVSLFSSIITYRLFFHRLRGFPGPLSLRVSKLWHVYKTLDSKNHLYLEGLREQYGSFVRTGPAEITVFDPDIVPAINSYGTKCTKPGWYDLIKPLRGLNTIRDKDEHDRRKRIWDKALSPNTLHEYEKRVQPHLHELDDFLSRDQGKAINVTRFFHFYSFDCMGDLGFAKSFNMIRSGKDHAYIDGLRRFMTLFGSVSNAPWACRIALTLPWIADGWKTFLKFCADTMEERQKASPTKQDIFRSLLDASDMTGTSKMNYEWLWGDSVAMIIAGSDSIALSLLFIFRSLCLELPQQEKLRAEILSLSSIRDTKLLAQAPHLNAVINETMRLYPPALTGGVRETGPDGLMVAGRYIPPGTAIIAPRFSLARLASCYERPNDFIPERWYSQPELIKDKRTFSPFSTGRYSCVGKHLGLMELRLALAFIISNYNVRLAPGEDGGKVWNELKDQFVMAPGPLHLVFERREPLESKVET